MAQHNSASPVIACPCGSVAVYDSAMMPDSDDVGTCLMCLTCGRETSLYIDPSDAGRDWRDGTFIRGGK